MEFGTELRKLRKQAGYSQNELARLSGIDPTNLNRMERSKQGPPRRTTLVKIVRGLGLSLDDDRSVRLFEAARIAPALPKTSLLQSPLRRREQDNVGVQLRELRVALLRAVDMIADLEQRTGSGS